MGQGKICRCSFQTPISTAAITAALLKTPFVDSQDTELSPRVEPYAPEIELPTRLRTLRHGRNLSLEEVARRVKVSRQTVWYWEKGRRTPSPQNLRLLAGALGAAESDLELKGEPYWAGRPDSFSTAKERIANELGIAPESVEIHIRL